MLPASQSILLFVRGKVLYLTLIPAFNKSERNLVSSKLLQTKPNPYLFSSNTIFELFKNSKGVVINSCVVAIAFSP